MSLGRRASIAGLESRIQANPALGGSFERRMSLASLGSRKYGRGCDSVLDVGRDMTANVIVRHIPIVIEGNESDSETMIVNEGIENVPARYMCSFPSEKSSSISSQSSDNSLESSRRKNHVEMEERMKRNEGDISSYKSWENWLELNRRGMKDRDIGGSLALRQPFKDVTPNKELRNTSQATRKTSLPGPQYLIKTETVGVTNCPVHGEGERRKRNSLREGEKGKTVEPASGPLKAPSLIRMNNTSKDKHIPDNKSVMIQNGRPKHSTNIPTKPSKENTGVETTDMNRLARGPGQWSVRGTTSKKTNDTNSDEFNKTNEKQTSIPAFQRRWSFRKSSLPSNKNPIEITMSFQAPTISGVSRSVIGPLQLPEYFRKTGDYKKEVQHPQLKTYTSQDDLSSQSIKPSSAVAKLKMTPSSSTSSIPSKVSKEFEHISKEKPPCIGILKTPGKRKISSNNRVEFLDNLREREIPGRHT